MGQKQRVWSGWLLGMALLLPGRAIAAEPPTAAQRVASETFIEPSWLAQVNPESNRFPPNDQPPQAAPLPDDDLAPTVAPPPEPGPPTSEPAPAPPLPDAFFVSDIQVTPSTVFDAATLEAVVQVFENRTLTLAELQQAADAVTQLYLEAGYITSRALVPAQTVTADGVVEIRVIEGALETIQVAGTDRLAEYVRSRVALGGGTPLNQNRLEDQLRLLRADPLFDNVEASLRAGNEVGKSILTVRVVEANPFSGQLTIDTLSPRSVGEFRLGATLQYRNLLGLGDRLTAAAYRSTTGGSQIYDLSFQVPVNPMNGTLSLRATPNNFRITDPTEPSFALGLSGSTDIYEVSFRQPLIRSPREELALSAGFRYRNGSTLLAGFITPPTITSVFTFGQDYLRRDRLGSWAVRSQFKFGTGLFDATALPTPLPDGQFFSWAGQIQRVQVLNPDHLLVVQGDLQLSPDSLLGSEQFFIGGAQSVRGYYQNARFGDNGVRLSIEDRITLQRDQGGSPVVQAIPFVDLGYVWANNPDLQVTRQNFLMGTGVGVLIKPLSDLDVRLDFGVPLVTLNELTSDRPSGLRVYFDVRYQF